MINYIIAFLLGAVIYLIAIRYLRELCPPSKLFKFIIYMCISTLAVPAVNFIHPIKNDSNGILTPIMNDISGTENYMGSDWQQAQDKANTLVNGGTGNTEKQAQNNYSNNEQNNYQNTQTSNQSDEQSQQMIIIGRDGNVVSDD